MRKPLISIIYAFILSAALTEAVVAHPGGHGISSESDLRLWTNTATGEKFRGSYLFTRGDQVWIERGDGSDKSIPIRDLAPADRDFAGAESERIRRVNLALLSKPSGRAMVPDWLLLTGVLVPAGFWFLRKRGLASRRLIVIGCLAGVFVAGTAARHYAAQSNRPAAADPFDAYAPKVRTRWDAKYLYVESDGMPDHPLMTGIKAWQQQVPVPQPYYSENAWSIPLNPVLAAQPVSAKTALFTGAIALAANGVPIFNALNNRGVDSYSIGELDEYGGHCGRADDYHYHAAPLHIQQKVGPGLPIGYALDGYPLYGLTEPDGSPAGQLDELNGHFDSAGKYHYHSTKTYPYINGGMRGVVTVSNDQIVPQSRAYSVRPFTQPLNGASITSWSETGANAWTLTYLLNGQTYRINYGTDGAGHFTYEFVDPSGGKRTENYTRQGASSIVSAASYQGSGLAPESICSLFGSNLSSAARNASTTPLPTDLNGTSVRVIDSLGVPRMAPLFYVSAGQVNCQVPPGTAPGTAVLSVSSNGAFRAFGTMNIRNVAPGLFTADASASGYAAALAYRYRGNELISVDSIVQVEPGTNRIIAKPLDLGPDTDTIFLALFGTGLRYRSGLSGVSASIGGTDAQVVFAGPHGDLVGVDQINVRVPRSLKDTAGDLNVVVTVDGISANTVKLVLKSGVAQSISWSMTKLPDTGQTGHYGSMFGEDSDYTINQPAYKANGDGTLTDLVTGLQWQQTDGGEMTWDNARSYCDSLSLGGRDDWRLPNVKESFSLLNHNLLNPAIDSVFTRTQAEYWWSSDLRSDDSSRAWATNAGGGSGPHPKSETVSAGGTKRFHSRCVRDAGGGLKLASIHTVNGDGTVTDNRTGLIWVQADTVDKTWDEALRYCEDLTMAGSSDWRLPNIKELSSINDESRVRPSLDATAFPGAPSALFWSSTTLINQTARAWTVDFTLGIASYNTKTDRLRIRCVRNAAV